MITEAEKLLIKPGSWELLQRLNSQKRHKLSVAMAHCVVNKEEEGRGGVSVNKDSVNQSHRVRGEFGLLINAGTASSKYERQRDWGNCIHTAQLPNFLTQSSSALHVSVSLCLCHCFPSRSLHCLRFFCTLVLLRLSRWLHTSALSCSTYNWGQSRPSFGVQMACSQSYLCEERQSQSCYEQHFYVSKYPFCYALFLYFYFFPL